MMFFYLFLAVAILYLFCKLIPFLKQKHGYEYNRNIKQLSIYIIFAELYLMVQAYYMYGELNISKPVNTFEELFIECQT